MAAGFETSLCYATITNTFTQVTLLFAYVTGKSHVSTLLLMLRISLPCYYSVTPVKKLIFVCDVKATSANNRRQTNTSKCTDNGLTHELTAPSALAEHVMNVVTM